MGVSSGYLDHLNPEQLEAATAMGTVCVLAGAGTGKTSTLTAAIIEKMESRNISHSRIFATTFTKKAAAEMASRITSFGATVPDFLGTFHSNARKLLTRFPQLCPGLDPRQLTILDVEGANSLIVEAIMPNIPAQFMRDLQDTAREGDFRPNGVSPSAMATKMQDIVSVMKMEGVSEDDMRNWVETKGSTSTGCLLLDEKSVANPAGAILASKFFRRYNRVLRSHAALDFDDLIALPTLTLRNNPSLQDMVSRQFDAVFVDEDQDTNSLQDEFLSYIAQRAKVIFRVGDDGQSIYGWRGSRVSLLRDFHKEADTTVSLTRNYRSTTPILDFSRDVLSLDPESMDKELSGENRSINTPDAKPVTLIEMGENVSQWIEAAFVAEQIAQRVEGGESPASFAVLNRSNFTATIVYFKLLMSGVPAVCDADDLFKLRIIRFVIAFSFAGGKPHDPLLTTRIGDLFNNDFLPAYRLGERTHEKLVAAIKKHKGLVAGIHAFRESTHPRLRGKADPMLDKLIKFTETVATETANQGRTEPDAGYVFSKAVDKSGLGEALEAESKRLSKLINEKESEEFTDTRALEELYRLRDANQNATARVDLITSAIKGATLSEAMDMMSLTHDFRPGDDKNSRPAVRVTTIHKAKGLEWDVVYVPFATGASYFGKAKRPAHLHEAVRCLYVAMTRGRHELIVTGSKILPALRTIGSKSPHCQYLFRDFYGNLHSDVYGEHENDLDAYDVDGNGNGLYDHL